MRCLAIAQAWQDRGGRVLLVSTSDAPSVLERLSLEKIEVHRISSPIGENQDALQTIQIAKAAGCSWVVVDGYLFGPEFHLGIQQSGLRLLSIDDLADLEFYGCDVVLNPNFYASPSLYEGKADGLAHLLVGTRYALLRREFLEIQRGALPSVKARVERLLLTLGGADPQNATRLLMEIFAKREMSCRMKITIVVGSANPHISSLEAVVPALEQKHDVELVVNPSNMPELIRRSDFAISAAGGSALELACLGTPMALVIAADNQRGVAASFESAGVALLLGDPQKLLRPDRLEELFEVFGDVEKRAQMQSRGRAIVDGQGAGRAVERLAAYPLQLRPAESEDARLLYEWANDPVARQMSFSSEPIPWEGHIAWFEKRLQSSDCRLRIGLNKEGKPAGQVRLERSEVTAVLSLSIDPAERGKGHGPKLARLAAVEALADGWCEEVHAWVKPENGASMNTFRKAEFVEMGIQKEHPNQAVLFVLRTACLGSARS